MHRGLAQCLGKMVEMRKNIQKEFPLNFSTELSVQVDAQELPGNPSRSKATRLK